MSDTQTIRQAKKLLEQADSSFRVAEIYEMIKSAIEALPVADSDFAAQEIIRIELARVAAQIIEFEDDADELLGQIDPELIEQVA